MNSLAALIVDEGNWPAVSMGLGLVAVAVLLFQHRRSASSTQRRVLAAMSLFFGVSIGTMAFGHLLAVTVKLAMGTLEGSTLLFYLIGVFLAVPSGWLVVHALKLPASEENRSKMTLGLNAWLAVTLLGLGLHNLPLAATGFLTMGYSRFGGRSTGWAIVGLAVVINVGLFVASLLFLASGQTFEQYRGLQ